MLFIDLTLNAMLSSATVVFTAILAALLGQRYPPFAWAGVGIACIGGLFVVRGGFEAMNASIQGDSSHSQLVLLGLALALLALILRAAKTVTLERIMRRLSSHDTEYPVVAPLQVMMLQAPGIALVNFVLSVGAEGFFPPTSALLSLHGRR